MNRITVSTFMFLPFLCVSLLPGCSSSSSTPDNQVLARPQADKDIPQTGEIEVLADDVVIEMMKHIPESFTEFEFIDVAALRADDDLEDLYADWEYKYGWVIRPLGVPVNQVTGFGTAGYTLLVEGDFTLAGVRETIGNQQYTKNEYTGAEVWNSDDSWVAIMKGLLLSANGQDGEKYMQVMSGESETLYDKKDFKDVVDRLPRGIILQFEESWFRYNYFYDGLKVSGMSVVKDDKYTMAFTWICKFEDAASVGEAMIDIENDMIMDGDDNWLNINMTQYQEFLKVTAELEIRDFINS